MQKVPLNRPDINLHNQSETDDDWTLVSQPNSSSSERLNNDELSSGNAEEPFINGDTTYRGLLEPIPESSQDENASVKVDEDGLTEVDLVGDGANNCSKNSKKTISEPHESPKSPILVMESAPKFIKDDSHSCRKELQIQLNKPRIGRVTITECKKQLKRVEELESAQKGKGMTVKNFIILVIFGLSLWVLTFIHMIIAIGLILVDPNELVRALKPQMISQNRVIDHGVGAEPTKPQFSIRELKASIDVNKEPDATIHEDHKTEVTLKPVKPQPNNHNEAAVAQESSRDRKFVSKIDNQVSNDVDFSQHAYPELKLLDEELADCIRRYEKDFVKQDETLRAEGTHNSSNRRLFKGIVCYDRETEWRKRIDQLKSEHHLDLQKLLRQARRKLTSNMLEEYHPSLSFKLIINQLDYLDYLDNKRRDRASERLKTENLDLKKRLDERTKKDGGNHENHMSSVENENSKLKAEVEALKMSLAEKAGTVYIKQSMELEKSERENVALKKFYNQVAQEVSKGLKRLNLHTIDAAAILDDHESLSSQLALTRGYLLRYVEEVGNLVSRNKILIDELHEIQAVAARQIEGNAEHHEDSAGTKVIVNNNGGGISEPQNSSGPDDIIAQSRDCSNNNQSNTDRSNWLMRRAKLRERLRKASIDHIMDHAKEYNKRFDKRDSFIAPSLSDHQRQVQGSVTSSGKHSSHGHKHEIKEHNYYNRHHQYHQGKRNDYNRFKQTNRDEL